MVCQPPFRIFPSYCLPVSPKILSEHFSLEQFVHLTISSHHGIMCTPCPPMHPTNENDRLGFVDRDLHVFVPWACINIPRLIFSCVCTIVCLSNLREESNFLLTFHCGLLSWFFGFFGTFPAMPPGRFGVLSPLGEVSLLANCFVWTSKQVGTPDAYILV